MRTFLSFIILLSLSLAHCSSWLTIYQSKNAATVTQLKTISNLNNLTKNPPIYSELCFVLEYNFPTSFSGMATTNNMSGSLGQTNQMANWAMDDNFNSYY